MKQPIKPNGEFCQLFDPDNTYLPAPIQRETLYSWCARLHRLNTNASARITSRQLFNDPLAGFRHDFPTHLDAFSENTHQLFGSIDELIYNRTVFAIFVPFLSESVTDAVIHNMHNCGDYQIKYQLGLLPSRVGIAAPLKACPSCMRIDALSSSVAWWHAEHQWPTVRICPEHGDYLLMATPEFHARMLNDWFLPEEVRPMYWQPPLELSEAAKVKLTSLCDWSLHLVNRYKNPFDSDLLRLTYHLRAKSMGWTTMDGALKFNQIRQAFQESYKCVDDLPGFSFIKETTQEHGGFIASILRKFEGNKHPLKHVVMMEFLFGEPDIFFAEYERLLSISIDKDKSELWAELTEPRNQLRLLVSDAGYSVNAAAKQLDLPVGQAIRFLRQEGVEYKRRPRVLSPSIETKLRQMLESGETRDAIASQLEIKKTFIKDYLHKNVELREIWQKEHQTRLLEGYRSHFIKLLNEHPGQTVKQMKQISGNGIQWLNRHDRAWLEAKLPSLWRVDKVS